MNIGLKEISGSFHVPRDFVLLGRTILLLTGVCTELDPELSPMEVIRPYLQGAVLGNRDWARIALEAAAEDMGLKAELTIPRRPARKYLTRANREEVEIQVKGTTQAAMVYAGACASSSARRIGVAMSYARPATALPRRPRSRWRGTASTRRERDDRAPLHQHRSARTR